MESHKTKNLLSKFPGGNFPGTMPAIITHASALSWGLRKPQRG